MTPIRQRSNTRQRGFTLIELALVVGIVALLLGGLMVPISRSLEQKAVATTQARLEAAQQALVGYALLKGHLPCPDTVNTGLAGATIPSTVPPTPLPLTLTGCFAWRDTDSATTPITPSGRTPGASWGHLPWAELGVDGVDGWGNRLDYAVYTPLVDPLTFNSSTVPASNLVVKCTHLTFGEVTGGGGIPGCLTSSTPTVVTPSSNASFVVYSHGKNGLGAVRPDGSANPLPSKKDEIQNLPANPSPHPAPLEASADDRRTFVFRPQTDATSSAGEFDDLMVWMPANLLAAKLLAAGKWP
jgi:prepilin-type N-terminal cleavage/methylation domain-containing protein